MRSKILIPACTALNSFHKVLRHCWTHVSKSFHASLHNTSQWNTSNQTRVDLNSSMTTTCIWSKRFFKNHQPTRCYTGNHCTISKYALEKPWKFLKNETQKFYSGGFCPGGFCLGGFCRGVYVRGVLVLEPFVPNLAPLPLLAWLY